MKTHHENGPMKDCPPCRYRFLRASVILFAQSFIEANPGQGTVWEEIKNFDDGLARKIIEDCTDNWDVRDGEVAMVLHDLQSAPITAADIAKEVRWIQGDARSLQ
jgi:hypothetical protein